MTALGQLLADLDADVPLLTPEEAAERRMKPLITPCDVAREGWMLKNFIRDMVRGGAVFALVACGGLGFLEIWRTGMRISQRAAYGSPSAFRHGGIRADRTAPTAALE